MGLTLKVYPLVQRGIYGQFIIGIVVGGWNSGYPLGYPFSSKVKDNMHEIPSPPWQKIPTKILVRICILSSGPHNFFEHQSENSVSRLLPGYSEWHITMAVGQQQRPNFSRDGVWYQRTDRGNFGTPLPKFPRRTTDRPWGFRYPPTEISTTVETMKALPIFKTSTHY